MNRQVNMHESCRNFRWPLHPTLLRLWTAFFPLTLLLSCTGGEAAPETAAGAAAAEVRVLKLRPGIYRPVFETSGTVVPVRRKTVSSPYSAELSGVYSGPGENAERGAPLARLSTASLEEELLFLRQNVHTKERELEAAELNLVEARERAEKNGHGLRRLRLQYDRREKELQEAEENYRRRSELREAGAISEEDLKLSLRAREEAEYELSRSRLLLAEAAVGFQSKGLEMEAYISRLVEREEMRIRIIEAELEEKALAVLQLEEKIEKSVVRSPIDGIIYRLFSEEGDFVQTGDPLFSIYDPRNLRIEVELGESNFDRIDIGSSAALISSEGGQILSTELSHILPHIDRRTKSFTAYLELPRGNKGVHKAPFYPGMFVRVELSTGPPRPAVALPTEALVRIETGVSPEDRHRGEVFVCTRESDGMLRVMRRSIHLVGLRGETAYAVDGIVPGEEICLPPHNNLYDGCQAKELKR